MASGGGFRSFDGSSNPTTTKTEETNHSLHSSKEILWDETENKNSSRGHRNVSTHTRESHALSAHKSNETPCVKKTRDFIHPSSENKLNGLQGLHSSTAKQDQSSDLASIDPPTVIEFGATQNAHAHLPRPHLKQPTKKVHAPSFHCPFSIPRLNSYFSSNQRNVHTYQNHVLPSSNEPSQPTVHETSMTPIWYRPANQYTFCVIDDDTINELNYRLPRSAPIKVKQTTFSPISLPRIEQPVVHVHDNENIGKVTKWLSKIDLCKRDSTLAVAKCQSSSRSLTETEVASIRQSLESAAIGQIASQNLNIVPPYEPRTYSVLHKNSYPQRVENVNIIVHTHDRSSARQLLCAFAKQSWTGSFQPLSYPVRLNVPRCGSLMKVCVWYFKYLSKSIELANSSYKSSKSVIVLVFNLTLSGLVSHSSNIKPLIDNIRRNQNESIPVILVGFKADMGNVNCFSNNGYIIKARYNLSAYLQISVDSCEVDSLLFTAVDISRLHLPNR